MPRFKTVTKHYTEVKLGDASIKFDVNINTDGLFTTNLDKEIGARLYEAKAKNLRQNNQHQWRFYSDETFDGLITKIDDDMTDLVSAKVDEEKLVIKYDISTAVTYVKLDEDFVPNGCYANREDWQFENGTTELHATKRQPYGFSFFVRPYLKTTYKYRSGRTRIEYGSIWGYINESHHSGPGQDHPHYNLIWLTHLVGMSSDASPFSNGKPDGLNEIDYTEQAAEFFVNMVKFLININERVKDFIEPEKIQLLIEGNMKLLDKG